MPDFPDYRIIILMFVGFGALMALLIALPFIIGSAVSKKSAKSRGQSSGGLEHLMADRILDIVIYAFDDSVQSMDDVTAIRINTYRETGTITSLTDDEPVMRRRFRPNRAAAADIARILGLALEVKRVSEKDVLYFFANIKPLTIKSSQAQSIYKCVSGCAANSQTTLCKLTTLRFEEDGEHDDYDENGEYADNGD